MRTRFSILIAALVIVSLVGANLLSASPATTPSLRPARPRQSTPDWVRVSTTISPPPRWLPAMAYDSNRGRIVLFGGVGGTPPYSSSDALDDTWEFDGVSWRRVDMENTPPGRWAHTMVYDTVRHRIVLFGGYNVDQQFGDTWEYDGETWVRITTDHLPGPVSGHGMSFDTNRGRTVVFSGILYPDPSDPRSGFILAEHWEYDGNDWEKQPWKSGWPARTGAQMVYDTRRGVTVLYGGQTSDTTTWEYNGTDWRQRTTVNSPGRRNRHAIAFDSLRRRSVLFGGFGANDRTWEYDGTDWVLIDTASAPSPRHGHAMAYHAGRAKVILFGGSDGSNLLNDTWEYGVPLEELLPEHVYLPIVLKSH